MQVRWKELKKNVNQKILDLSPEEFGDRFTNFMKNGCQFIFFGEQKLFLPQSFDWAKFITELLGENWTIWKGPADGNGLSGEEDVDPRCSQFSEIEVSKFKFETCLEKGEKLITGEEKLRRLKEKSDFIRFGVDVFSALWDDYREKKEDSILESLYKPKRITHLDFMGIILRDPGGSRHVLYLYRGDDGGWYWDYRWLDCGWDVCYFSAGCAST